MSVSLKSDLTFKRLCSKINNYVIYLSGALMSYILDEIYDLKDNLIDESGDSDYTSDIALILTNILNYQKMTDKDFDALIEFTDQKDVYGIQPYPLSSAAQDKLYRIWQEGSDDGSNEFNREI